MSRRRNSSKNASMPNLAKGDQLLPANALIHAMRFLQLSIGAMIAGLVTEWLGYRAAFVINAASFVVSAFFIGRIAIAALEPDLQALAFRAASSARSLTADVREAIVFIWRTPLVLAITAVNFGWAFGGGMSQVINDPLITGFRNLPATKHNPVAPQRESTNSNL